MGKYEVINILWILGLIVVIYYLYHGITRKRKLNNYGKYISNKKTLLSAMAFLSLLKKEKFLLKNGMNLKPLAEKEKYENALSIVENEINILAEKYE